MLRIAHDRWGVILHLLILLNPSCQSTDMVFDSALPSTIYGGTAEPEWPGIGAIADSITDESHCSAVLIDEHWILTAAHCVSEWPVHRLRFRVGQSSQFPDMEFPVAEIHIHPLFLEGAYVHDVAALRIEGTTDALEPLSLNSAPFDERSERTLRYVGYGYDETGHSGEKRSAEMPVTEIGITVFSTTWQTETSTGVCFGDSGGAVLQVSETDVHLVGILSSITPDPEAADICIGVYTASRVDRYLPWIRETIGLSEATCPLESECFCLVPCDEDDDCDDVICGHGSCEDGFDCLRNCDTNSATCINDCYVTLTLEEGRALYAFITCGANHCANQTALTILDCLNEYCHTALHRCFAATDCDLTGGDCPPETTCRIGRFSLTSCQPHGGALPGEFCVPGPAEDAPCPDGFECIESLNGYRCLQLCRTDAHCDDIEICRGSAPFPSDAPEIRHCIPRLEPIAGCQCEMIGRTTVQRRIWPLLLRF